MPTFDLTAAAKRNGLRRNITLRPIDPTQSHAQELASLYLAVARVWQRNTPAIMAGYTVPTLDALTTDSPADHAAAITATENEVTRLVIEFTAAVRAFGVRVERWHRDKWIAAVKAGTSIDLGTILTAFTTQETLEAFLERNVALVKDISDQAKGRISDAVFRAYQNRTPVRELAKEIAEATGMARKRAVRVASHQNAALSATLDTERQAEAGIDKIKWRHSGKRFPRASHKARDGKLYFLRTRKAVVGGETVAAGDWCGQPPWCGCRASAYLDIMAEVENA